MANPGITPEERLMFDIETSDDFGDNPPAIAFADIGRIAKGGKLAITAIYAETLLTIDRMPRDFRLSRLGRTALSSDAQNLIGMVDESIATNPLYNSHQYSKLRGEYWLATESSTRSVVPKNGFLVENLAERGLAYLYASVASAASVKSLKPSKSPSISPISIIRSMEMNGSVDSDTLSTLRGIWNEGSYSNIDYATGLLGISYTATKLFLEKQKLLPAADTESKTHADIASDINKKLEYHLFERRKGLKILGAYVTAETISSLIGTIFPAMRPICFCIFDTMGGICMISGISTLASDSSAIAFNRIKLSKISGSDIYGDSEDNSDG
jgi:hypothetical protein